MTMVAVTNRPVLVLNKSWQAIHVTNVERAIVMLFSADGDRNKARVIDPNKDFETFTWEDWSQLKPVDGELTIRSGRDAFRVPEVILLSDYDKLPQSTVQFSRRQLYKRDNYMCQYCGARPGTEELSIDHIIPQSRGGATTWTNCTLACVDCNSKKADRTPKEAGMFLRRKPAKPQFNLIRCDKALVPLSWKNFISAAYWNVEMENSNPE